MNERPTVQCNLGNVHKWGPLGLGTKYDPSHTVLYFQFATTRRIRGLDIGPRYLIKTSDAICLRSLIVKESGYAYL